jgi:hypothetical protein
MATDDRRPTWRDCGSNGISGLIPPGLEGLAGEGPDGLLKQLTKAVLETALSQEMTGHPGHDKHGPAGHEAGNVRNGTRGKTGAPAEAGRRPSIWDCHY